MKREVIIIGGDKLWMISSSTESSSQGDSSGGGVDVLMSMVGLQMTKIRQSTLLEMGS